MSEDPSSWALDKLVGVVPLRQALLAGRGTRRAPGIVLHIASCGPAWASKQGRWQAAHQVHTTHKFRPPPPAPAQHATRRPAARSGQGRPGYHGSNAGRLLQAEAGPPAARWPCHKLALVEGMRRTAPGARQPNMDTMYCL